MSGSDLDQDFVPAHLSCMDPCQDSSSNAQLNVDATEDPSNDLNSIQDEDNETDSNTETPEFVNIVVLLLFMIVDIPERW